MTWTPTIDDDIPLPPPSRGDGAPPGKKFRPPLRLRMLLVGQSMFVPAHVCSRKKINDRVTAMARRGWDMKFALRAWEEAGVDGTRIWRVS